MCELDSFQNFTRVELKPANLGPLKFLNDSFMKLRLDRVLKLDLGKMNIDTATESTAPIPEFKQDKKWIAPYAPYAAGWWEVFMRK